MHPLDENLEADSGSGTKQAFVFTEYVNPYAVRGRRPRSRVSPRLGISLPVSLSPSKERIAAPLLSSASLSNLSGVLMRERTGFEALHASGDH